MPRSYWSLKKYGRSENSVGSPSIDAAAAAGWFGGRRQLDVGRGTDTDEHCVGRHAAAVRQTHADGGPVLGMDGSDVGTELKVDSVIPVQVGEDLTQPRTEDRQERQFGRFQHRDPRIGITCGCRHFPADPSAADDDEPLSRAE